MKTRQQFDEAVKDEIAQAWYYRTMTSKEIEARGIQMSNVYRWMADKFGPGPRPPKGTAPPPPKNGAPKNGAPKNVSESASTSAAGALVALSRRKIKKGANGRYPDEVREQVTPLLLQKVPVPEIAEKTGINAMTLYLWRDAAKKKSGAAPNESKNGGALVVVPKAAPQARVPSNSRVEYGELLTNEATVKAMFDQIQKSEGFVNLKKIVDELDAAHRAGEIEMDHRDHRLMMAYKQIIGAPMRGARR